jgi:hypothetical protein
MCHAAIQIANLRCFTVFVEADKPPKAMIAYEKALDWQELFDLAMQDNIDQDDLSSMGLRVAGMRELTSLNNKLMTCR